MNRRMPYILHLACLFLPMKLTSLNEGEKSEWNKNQSWAEGHSLWQIVMTLPHLSGSAALTPGNTHHTDLCTIAQNWLFSDNQVSQTPSERRKEMLPCKNSCSTKASGYVCALWPRAATDTQRPLTIKFKTSRLKHKGTSETCCYTARIVFTTRTASLFSIFSGYLTTPLLVSDPLWTLVWVSGIPT